jgi:uncharacterized protein YqjF (DUF2071 family)
MPHGSLARVDHRPWPVPTGPWIGRQCWHDLLFAHWPLPASVLQPFVPPSVRVQEFEGTSWVGLVPFHMSDVMLRGVPALPAVSAFPEMNLRLYVEHQGRSGVWFISLDAGNPLAVWVARHFVHLPYFRASMHVGEQRGRIVYRSSRRGDRPVVLRGSYAPAGAVFEARRGSLEYFLAERYALFTRNRAGEILIVEIHHQPWPLQAATAEFDVNTVGSAQAIPLAGPPALLHFSRRQDVIVWPVRHVRQSGTDSRA